MLVIVTAVLHFPTTAPQSVSVPEPLSTLDHCWSVPLGTPSTRFSLIAQMKGGKEGKTVKQKVLLYGARVTAEEQRAYKEMTGRCITLSCANVPAKEVFFPFILNITTCVGAKPASSEERAFYARFPAANHFEAKALDQAPGITMPGSAAMFKPNAAATGVINLYSRFVHGAPGIGAWTGGGDAWGIHAGEVPRRRRHR